MTPQESTMLNDLVSKIQQTQLPEKDEEAESFLQQNLGRNPDGLYILAQTVIVQNIALDRAKAQVQQLQQQLQDAQAHAVQQSQPQHTSFLGSLLGHRDPAPPPPPPPQNFSPRPAAPAPQYYPPAPAYAPEYSAAPPPPPPPPGGGSSFLRSAATTAAGVAAGALAFEGVESLLHGFGHSGGGFGEPSFGGGGFGGGGFGERPEETVINNYYDDPNQSLGGMQEHHEHEASFDERPGGFSGDRGGDGGAQLQDASYDPGSFTEPQGIDTLDDDQTTGGIDDSSSFDDSGSFDDGGGSNDV
jgi:uncharacterized protein